VIVTSNRDVGEWLALFDDPILANSALDRLTHNSYHLVMEGESYRKRTSPHARRAQAAMSDAP
jgi:DNA replication protein DnaC